MAEVRPKHLVEAMRIAFIQGHDLSDTRRFGLRNRCGHKTECHGGDKKRCEEAYR
jgi:hypothetical protein